ncbi:MAG: sulfurtransferase [Roseovarius sp.]|nr:sulfurtransferase [Roseovarius sp.]
MTTLPHLCRRAASAVLIAGFALAPLGLAAAPLDLTEPVAEDSLPKSKHTKPGLYITAAEAGRVLEEHDTVALIDVRTPSEIMLIGYATPTAAAIPAQFVDPDIGEASKDGTYKMVSNPGFEAEILAWLASDAAKGIDTLLVTCRSGSRSAPAIDRMVEAGVDLPLYSVVDGFEGDKNENGVRDVNGWRNAGLPWTYKIRDGLRPAAN